LFRNGLIEVELCKIIEKTYQLRVRQIGATGESEINSAVYSQIIKAL
jgi:hypothetical protein